MTAILRSAVARLTVRFALQQFSLALLVFLLFLAWLRIPDSGIAAVLATGLLAALIVALALFGEASILRRFAGLPSTPGSLFRGAIALLAAGLLWSVLSILLDHLGANDALRAGYLNSQSPHALRSFLTYQHLLEGLGWGWRMVRWLAAGILLAAVVAVTQSAWSVRATLRVLRSAKYWLTLLLSEWLGSWLTTALLGWTPGYSLRTQTISLALRLGVVVIFDLLLAYYLLAVTTTLVQQSDESHSIP